jgi:glutamate racemase
LSEAIRQLFGNQLKLIDSGVAVARQTSRILSKHALLNNQPMSGTQIYCYASGGKTPQLVTVIEHLMPLHLRWEIANPVL